MKDTTNYYDQNILEEWEQLAQVFKTFDKDQVRQLAYAVDLSEQTFYVPGFSLDVTEFIDVRKVPIAISFEYFAFFKSKEPKYAQPFVNEIIQP